MGDFFMGVLSFFCALVLMVNGLYLTFRSKFFQFSRLGLVFNVTFKKLVKSRDSGGFKAMSIALGSTIGIGNIIGVAAAITVGGAGAILWMLVTGFLGMIIKFAEVYICVDEAKSSHRNSGGPMYVLSKMASGKFKMIGCFFAGVTVLASFFAGNLMQSKAVYRFAHIGFDVGFVPVTLILLPLLFVILLGKDRLYQNFSAIFVPLMALFYISAVLIIIFINFKYVPSACVSVLTSAFGFRQAVGGFSGAIISSALRTGVMKGIFTHEAGMGSAPIAHSCAEKTDPFSQGCWGIVEVFIDTVVVCMLTALAVLSSPVYLELSTSDPFELISKIFESVFGSFGIKTLSLSAILFAFASIVGWSYYGIKALEFFTKVSRAKKMYTVVFLAVVPLSCVINDSFAWILTDLFNSLMLIPNSIMLMMLGGKAVDPLSKIKKVLEIG